MLRDFGVDPTDVGALRTMLMAMDTINDDPEAEPLSADEMEMLRFYLTEAIESAEKGMCTEHARQGKGEGGNAAKELPVRAVPSGATARAAAKGATARETPAALARLSSASTPSQRTGLPPPQKPAGHAQPYAAPPQQLQVLHYQEHPYSAVPAFTAPSHPYIQGRRASLGQQQPQRQELQGRANDHGGQVPHHAHHPPSLDYSQSPSSSARPSTTQPRRKRTVSFIGMPVDL